MPTIRNKPVCSRNPLPEKNSTASSFTTRGKLSTKPIRTTEQDCLSNLTVSIQNIKFPDVKDQETGAFKVKKQSDLLTKPQSKTIPVAKERGYDFSSSTNSHYAQMLVTVPKKFRAQCSSSTTEFQKKAIPSVETSKTSEQNYKSIISASKEMTDSKHAGSEKRMNLHGSEWRQPCKESFVAGAPQKLTGVCPPNYEKLSKMSKMPQKCFLTQDPHKVHCLVNPEMLRSKEYSKKKEFNALTKMVKHAQNICAATASESSEDFICEVIDLENPLQLDFQGLDYSNTYEKDEQDFQNQQNFRRVCRYMDRKRVKAETETNVEKEIHEEMINIPKRFNIRDRSIPVESAPSEKSPKLGQLYRSADKPYNQKRINSEKEERKKRYKDLYLHKKVKEEQIKQSNKIQEKIEADNLAFTLADKNFKKLVSTINETIEISEGKKMPVKKFKLEKRKFPCTLKETENFKKNLKQKNLALRDKAKIVKDFFLEKKGKLKDIPEASLEISSDTQEPYEELTEQSTDYEDGMEVGKKGSKFKLRGFQYKLGPNLRGKLTQTEKLKGTRKEKGCITREQWLKELAPKKQQIKLDVEMGIIKRRSPDDPQLVLFPPSFGFKQTKAEHSAVREFRNKPLGRHYDRVLRKNLKFIKPRLRYNVKKFNLISYRFGDTAKRFNQLKISQDDVPMVKLKSTNEYMQAKALKQQRRKDEIKQKRLQLLGIPCRPLKKSRLQSKCENSSTSSDSDWVPKREPAEDYLREDRFQEREHEIRPLRMRCNMPAPKYREPTLRQHPRCPRDYKNLRVPSEIFDQVVLTTDLPYLQKLDQDKIQYANVDLQKRPYSDKFEARHHHDHWNATQVKKVQVHYQSQLIKPEITKVKKKSDRVVIENFHFANPPCNQYVDMDLTLPQYDIEEMIKDHSKATKMKTKEIFTIKTKNLCTQQDYKLRTRDPQELREQDYPGRQEYLELIRDVRESIKESNQQEEEEGQILHVNKTDILKELEEDLKSIESCLTSLSSSECTNLTNDSGSFLLMEGKEKIPLDYIRKSIVPFEELQRSRFQAKPIDVDKEQNNPFQVMPFSGQIKAQQELATAKDSFFTFNTRLKNGLRLRLEVPVEDVREKLLGKGVNKYKGVVTTDIDENYVDELRNRPPVKQFKFKSGQSFIKDALRLKFESMLIQGQMVRTKIYDRMNEQNWSDMQRVKLMFEKLFAKWEKREYDASMSVVYKVKNFYDETDRLKTEFKQLERELTMLNMDIVFIEGHWMRCIMLQNFHYLMGDQEWRLEHDWIHRLPSDVEGEIELENFDDSILKRSTLNIRNRDKDDAWAVKAFYEEVYSKNTYPNLVVFPSADKFLDGLENLKTKTFILLLEMHFTLAIHAELYNKLETFIDWSAEDLKERKEYVDRKCAKLYFMADRAKWLRQRTLCFLNEPIKESFNDETFHKDRAVIAEAWRRIVPANMRSTSESELYPVDMVAMISDVVIGLLSKFETVAMELSQQNEIRVRWRRAYLRKQSYQACHIERRIEREMEKVVRNLEPPYQMPKRSGKLPRYYLKKRVKPVKVEGQKITERAKFFIRAFNEEGAVDKSADIKGSLTQLDGTQEQIVPFYFDYFLKLNGYTPNYNFKTQVELRDGPEIERLQVRSVIPEVQNRLEQWEEMKKKIMEENIAQNPKMYVDVMT